MSQTFSVDHRKLASNSEWLKETSQRQSLLQRPLQKCTLIFQILITTLPHGGMADVDNG